MQRYDHTYLRDALKRERRGELLQLDIKLFARVAFKNVPLPALPALHDLTAPAARRIDDEQIKRTFGVTICSAPGWSRFRF